MADPTRFVAALARRPSPAVTQGLRVETGPDPDPEAFAAQHEGYLRELEDLGLAVTVLAEDADLPDSVFVEDTALCFPDFAIITRPGAPSRAAEVTAVRDALTTWYSDIVELPHGHCDGGDVLWTGREVVIGLSSRTDQQGADALIDLLRSRGIAARSAPTPSGVLHFKSDSAVLDQDTILATQRLAATGVFDSYRVVTVPPGEEPAANVVAINGQVLMPTGCPGTRALIEEQGYAVIALDNTEPAKIDGGLSCMSLRIPAG